MQDSLEASLEAQRLTYERQQQMMPQAAETRSQAELSASQAWHQAVSSQKEMVYQRERAMAQAEAMERQREIANSQAATLRQEREWHLATAEIRRAEAEVRRQEAEQRRQAAELSRQAMFGAPSEREANSAAESMCSGFIEGEVWDENGNVTWSSKLCGHDRCRMNDRGWDSSQAVCNGYVDQEVMDEQGNPKWISRLCDHEQCRNLFQ